MNYFIAYEHMQKEVERTDLADSVVKQYPSFSSQSRSFWSGADLFGPEPAPAFCLTNYICSRVFATLFNSYNYHVLTFPILTFYTGPIDAAEAF